jgi:hypothetical protein
MYGERLCIHQSAFMPRLRVSDCGMSGRQRRAAGLRDALTVIKSIDPIGITFPIA